MVVDIGFTYGTGGLGERVTARKVCGFLLFLFARASGGSEAFVERGLWC